MKPKILISTIVRNRGVFLDEYFEQIKSFVERLSDKYDFSISIYENDSSDNSKEIIHAQDYSHFYKSFIKTEDINTQFFGSVTDAQRVINFAAARNKTFEGVDLTEYQWLLIIEPDIIYSDDIINAIINREGLSFEPDVYSGILMQYGVPYDTWGMRRTFAEEWGGFYGDADEQPIREFWTTANGVCLYTMKPFIEGLKFSSFNKRLNKHDCDTAVLCEDFRERGYSKIFINQSIRPNHER